MGGMTIGKKLMIAFASSLAAAMVLAGAYLYSVAALSGELTVTIKSTAKKTFLVAEIQGQLFKMRACQRGVLLFSIENARDTAAANKQEFETRAAEVGSLVEQIKPLLTLDKARVDLASIESQSSELKGYFEQVAERAMAGDAKGAAEIDFAHNIKLYDSLEASARDLLDIEKQGMQESSERGAAAASHARWAAWSLALIALAIAPITLMLIIRTTRQLRDVAAHLHDGAQQITSAASQVASSSQTLAQGASEQASSLEETSASSEEITSMTRKNAENSQAAAAVMSEVDQRVAEGNRTLEEMIQSMQEITGSSDKISKIIKVIDEIAFQTNILALNAAVEAARAGEAGMGFAVVADEVRSLAQRSAQAAKDTASLIEESIGKSNEGSQRLEHVAQVIHAITESASKVKTLVDEVNLGSQEQARGIEHISKSIAEMDRVTQSNAASAEQSASASEEMSAQSEALQNIARELRELVGGESASASPAARRPESRKPSPVSAPSKPSQLAALRSAVAPARKSKPDEPVHTAANAIPLEDDFVNM